MNTAAGSPGGRARTVTTPERTWAKISESWRAVAESTASDGGVPRSSRMSTVIPRARAARVSSRMWGVAIARPRMLSRSCASVRRNCCTS